MHNTNTAPTGADREATPRGRSGRHGGRRPIPLSESERTNIREYRRLGVPDKAIMRLLHIGVNRWYRENM